MKAQEKAKRSAQITRLKAQKLEEIDRLRQLELEQKQIIGKCKGNKEFPIKRIVERVKSIGVYSRNQIPIEPVFDNTIEAIKIRIAKEQHMKALDNQRRSWAIENVEKRNKIIAMKEALRESLKRTRERNLKRIKSLQSEYFNIMHKRIKDKCGELKKLTNIENELIKKLKGTQATESKHLKSSFKLLNLSGQDHSDGNSETSYQQYNKLLHNEYKD